MTGAVGGSVRTLLRLEGLFVLAASAILYARFGHGWGWFVGLLLVPDLAMLGYFAGPRVGARVYNLVHVYPLPLALALFGVFAPNTWAIALALIWIAHIGMDHAAGYGLKSPTGFHDTHLGTIGRRR